MDKINYLSSSATAQSGKFPLTIQNLDFVQKQILSVQNTTLLGGSGFYVIEEPSGEKNGVFVCQGEILPLIGEKTEDDTHIEILTTKESILTDSGTFDDVRVFRKAYYTKKEAPKEIEIDLIPLDELSDFSDNCELLKRLEELNKQLSEYKKGYIEFQNNADIYSFGGLSIYANNGIIGFEGSNFEDVGLINGININSLTPYRGELPNNSDVGDSLKNGIYGLRNGFTYKNLPREARTTGGMLIVNNTPNGYEKRELIADGQDFGRHSVFRAYGYPNKGIDTNSWYELL